ncbi:MAG: chitobiase/beta-hexosaminidase C-terminal domain-containing protein [Candidatus Pacebacteria bacterium]|nr:chitobiase/beta-hexosaminidase C-terminal domain-containing protein [Candidatus Paceibacterota bacterium]
MSSFKNKTLFSVLLVGILIIGGTFFNTKTAHAAAVTVSSAKVVGPNQVQIVFSGSVDWTIAKFTNLTIGEPKTVSTIAETAPGTTVTITFTGTAVGTAATGTIDIASIADGGSGNTFAGQAGQVLSDGQAPVIGSMALTNPTTITVTFSEAVKTPSTSTANNWTLSGGAGSPTIASVQNIASGSTTQTITISDYTGGQMQLLYTTAGSQDITDTSVGANSMVTTTAADVVDSTVPTIASIALTNPTTITVTYTEQVKTASTSNKDNWVLSAGAGSPTISSVQNISAGSTTQTITIAGYAGGQMQLLYTTAGTQDITDTSTAANALATTTAANVVDSTVPTIASIALTSPTTITVTYSEQVTTPATSSKDNWTLSGGTGSPTISSVSDIHTTPSITQTITIAGYTGGQLQLAYTTVGGSAVTDSSAALNALAIAVAADVVDTTLPTFTASRTALNTIVLTFSETVTGTAILNSFTVEGASAVTNTAPTGSTTVTLTTTGLTATGGTPAVGYVAATGNIRDGATSPNEVADGGAILAADHIKPTVTSAKITGPNQITVVYGEAVTSVASDYTNLVLTAGGARSVDSVSGSGTTTIVLTFSGAASATDDTATMDIGATVLDTSPATNSLTAVTGQAVTDAQKPTFTADRTALNTIVLTFSENVTGTAIADSFTVAGASSVTNTAVTGGTAVTLTTVGLTSTSSTPAVGYVAATGDIVDDSAALNEIANGGAIAATDHVRPTFTADRTALNTIVLTFSELVDTTTTSGEGYAVAGATVVANTDPAGTSNVITLTTTGLTSYNGTALVTYTQSAGTTVDASAQANEVANSFSATASDAIAPFAPTASLTPGVYSGTKYVDLASVGSTSIRYTVNGTTPTCSSGTVYTGSITVSASETINAIGCDDASSTNSSSVASFAYSISTHVGGGGGGYGYTSTTESTTTTTPATVTTNTGAGCASGDKFSKTTGMICPIVTTTISGCAPGNKFSATTGQACGTNATGTVTTPAPQSVNYKGVFTRSLTIGSTGNDVKALQQFLNDHGFPVSTSGVGSKGNESTTFGVKTKTALAKFQAGNGISPAVGYFGPLTRAFVEALFQ